MKEQSSLEQKAKRHLEEELRSDMEEKEHIIKALQTKVTLLKSNVNMNEDNDNTSLVEVDIDSSPSIPGSINGSHEKVAHLEGIF